MSTLIEDYSVDTNVISGFSNLNNNNSSLSNILVSSSSSLNNNLVSSISSLNNNFNYYYTKTTTNSLLTNYATLGNLFDTTNPINNALSIYALDTNLVRSNTNLLSRIIR